jgi:hypothetical protein
MLSEIHRHSSLPQPPSMLIFTTSRTAEANLSSLRVLTNSAYIQTGASVLENLSSSLSTCPSDYYVVVYQPGVHSSDFSTRKSAPRLGAKMLGKDSSIRSKMSVDEVAGLVEPKEVKRLLETKCNTQTTVIDGSCESWRSLTWYQARVEANNLQLDHTPRHLRRVLGSLISSSPCYHWTRTARDSFRSLVRRHCADAMHGY